MHLRPYQAQCCSAVLNALAHQRSTLVVMATGLGKTVVFAEIASRWPSGRVLVVAHREELVAQAAEQLRRATARPVAIEMAEQTIRRASLWQESIVVASIQSLSRVSRLEHPMFHPGAYGLLITDEAHHAVKSNKTYADVIHHFQKNPALRHLGVTATPDRADETSLGDFFESVAFRYDIREAVDNGFLVPIKQQYVRVTDLDYSQVRAAGGDLCEADLERILTEENVLHKVAAPTVELAGNRPTLVFCASVRHAERLAEILCRYKPYSAVCLHGKTNRDVRREALRAYTRGEFQFLVGCGLFLEGFDSPNISCVVMARPTKSRALYAQAIGRGTRTQPGLLTPDLANGPAEDRIHAIGASAKPDLLVLDFVGNSGRHKLVTTADILAGNASEGAIRRARENADRRAGPVDMRREIQQAEEELEAEEAERQEAQRREAQRRERFVAVASYRVTRVSPFDNEYEAAPSDRSYGYKRHEPPTEKQAKYLASRGIDTTGLTRHEASQIIGDILSRLRNGTCTMKQASLLLRHGEPADTPLAKAELLITILRARGWRQRDYPITRDRLLIRKTAEGRYRLVVMDDQAGLVPLKREFRSAEDCRAYYASCVEEEPTQGVPA